MIGHLATTVTVCLPLLRPLHVIGLVPNNKLLLYTLVHTYTRTHTRTHARMHTPYRMVEGINFSFVNHEIRLVICQLCLKFTHMLCCTAQNFAYNALINAQYLPIVLKLCSIFYSSVTILCYQSCTLWVNSNYLRHRM